MKDRKSRWNPKRRIAADVNVDIRARLVEVVSYGGNPEHKRNPGDFGLSPPALPRADKALCDEVEIFRRDEALRLLKRGICRGLVSNRRVGNFPQNVWTVTDVGVPLEAQLENQETGAYLGYPLLETDPFSRVVTDAWDAASPCGHCEADGRGGGK